VILKSLADRRPQQQARAATGGRRGQVWSKRRPIGFPNAISTTGGIAAPLLAGFALTTVVQIVSAERPPRLANLAVASFTVAAALLLYALQFSALALGYSATPQQRLEYFPEASISDKALAKVRSDQWAEMWLRAAYSKRAALCYDLGLIVFLLGLGAVVVPSGHWSWGTVAALVVVALATGLEVAWTVSRATWPPRVLPTRRQVPTSRRPHHLADEGRALLYGSSPDVEVLLKSLIG
jgi:hypothetical protein